MIFRKFTSVAALVLAASTTAISPTTQPEAPLPKTPAGKLIVHEWGTFTNFAGSDGVYLDYRPLIANDLPEFVFDRAGQTSIIQQRPKVAGNPFGKYRIVSRSRMETPVTYFYTDAPMEIEARVEFPKGLLTDVYPPAKAMTPLVETAEAEGKKAPPIANGTLDWGRFTVIPQGTATAEQRKLPEVKSGDHYAAARATDSDVVELQDRPFYATYREKFLFYRGVGNFDLPVTMKGSGHDRFNVINAAAEPISAAFLVEIQGGRVRFAHYTKIASQAPMMLPPEASTLDALGDAMAADLTDAGLYSKESRAMVDTWKNSWFGEDGTRLLYLLPQSQTDAVIPLHITPTPQKTTRIMVGRLEALTPESEAGLTTLIQKMGNDDPRARERASRQLRQYGRFAEPALRRVGQMNADPEIRSRTEMLLGELRPKAASR